MLLSGRGRPQRAFSNDTPKAACLQEDFIRSQIAGELFTICSRQSAKIDYNEGKGKSNHNRRYFLMAVSVLIVEDDRNIAELLQMYLEK